MAVIKSLAGLRDPFLIRLLALEGTMRDRGIHMVRWETLRTAERQAELKSRGASRAGPGESPHEWGLAADYVLDVERVPVRRRAWGSKMVLDAWDHESPRAVATWAAFGQAVRDVGLVWGGDWPNFVDRPHVELPRWRDLIP